MGFLNMVIASFVFHILLYISQFSACFSLRHYEYEARCSRRACCSTDIFKCFSSCCLNLQYLTVCPVHLWVSFLFCFSCPVLLRQLSERARERKVPVTRIGRLANFGGEFARPCLQSDHTCTC